jgi:hypothetical protein
MDFSQEVVAAEVREQRFKVGAGDDAPAAAKHHRKPRAH